jgi:hypothetical protein
MSWNPPPPLLTLTSPKLGPDGSLTGSLLRSSSGGAANQSQHYSHTFPAISYAPHGLLPVSYSATRVVRFGPCSHELSLAGSHSFPQGCHSSPLWADQDAAFSHSASVRSRTPGTNLASHRQKTTALLRRVPPRAHSTAPFMPPGAPDTKVTPGPAIRGRYTEVNSSSRGNRERVCAGNVYLQGGNVRVPRKPEIQGQMHSFGGTTGTRASVAMTARGGSPERCVTTAVSGPTSRCLASPSPLTASQE